MMPYKQGDRDLVAPLYRVLLWIYYYLGRYYRVDPFPKISFNHAEVNRCVGIYTYLL